MAKIVDAVEAGIKLQTICVDDTTIFVSIHIFPKEQRAQESFVKNLFLYSRLKKITHAGQTVYIKNLATGDLFGYYNNEQATILYLHER